MYFLIWESGGDYYNKKIYDLNFLACIISDITNVNMNLLTLPFPKQWGIGHVT